MAQHNVLAMPVFDAGKKVFCGMISTFDIVMYVAYGVFQEGVQSTRERMEEKIAHAKIMPASQLIGLAEYSKSGWFYDGLHVYNPDRDVFELLQPLTKGVQRVLVRGQSVEKDEAGGFISANESTELEHRILSQIDVLRFLCMHPEIMKSIADKPIKELGLGSFGTEQQAVTVFEDESALVGYRLMMDKKADVIAVVNSQFALATTLSASDLRGLKLSDIGLVLMPIKDFLQQRRGSRNPPPVTCTLDDTYQHVINAAVIGRVHRVVVVDHHQRPQGVLRLTDLLAVLLRH
eukprot:Colp12_sorted_trinity150504_noHs@18752